jgi:tetratricopeptide (TPR) repeat protein
MNCDVAGKKFCERKDVQLAGAALFLFLLSCFVLGLRGDNAFLRRAVSSLKVFNGLVKNRDATKEQAKWIEVQYSRPSYTALIKHIFNVEPNQNGSLTDYAGFYKKVVELFPDQAEGYGFLGYIYFYTGEKTKALEAYRKALELKPYFFYYAYNLLIIQIHLHDEQGANETLERALKMNSDVAIDLMGSSNLYKDIFHFIKGLDRAFLEKRLKDNAIVAGKMKELLNQHRLKVTPQLSLF